MKKNNNTLLNAANYAVEYAKKIGAQNAEVRIIKKKAIQCEVRKQKIENLNHEKNINLNIRVFYKNAYACVTTANIKKEALENSTQRALDIAKYAPPDPDVKPAQNKEIIKKIPKLNIFDEKNPNEKTLEEIAKNAENTAQNIKGITQVAHSEAATEKKTFIFITTNGEILQYQKSLFHISCHALAGKGTNMESDYDYDQKTHFNDLKNPQIIAQNAAKRALRNLNPKKIKSDTMPVIFEPRIAAQFIHIITKAIAGNEILRSASFLKDKINQNIANQNINLIDNPIKQKGIASKPFDAEGLKTKNTILIENGILKTYLLDIRTAKKLKTKSNAYAAGTANIQPQPTNTYIKAGKIKPEDIIKQCKKALYVTALLGSGANIATGNYSCGAKGFLIQNGEMTYPVSEITIAGNLTEMLKMMIPANDLVLDKIFNAPTLYIEKMTVAGK